MRLLSIVIQVLFFVSASVQAAQITEYPKIYKKNYGFKVNISLKPNQFVFPMNSGLIEEIDYKTGRTVSSFSTLSGLNRGFVFSKHIIVKTSQEIAIYDLKGNKILSHELRPYGMVMDAYQSENQKFYLTSQPVGACELVVLLSSTDLKMKNNFGSYYSCSKLEKVVNNRSAVIRTNDQFFEIWDFNENKKNIDLEVFRDLKTLPSFSKLDKLPFNIVSLPLPQKNILNLLIEGPNQNSAWLSYDLSTGNLIESAEISDSSFIESELHAINDGTEVLNLVAPKLHAPDSRLEIREAKTMKVKWSITNPFGTEDIDKLSRAVVLDDKGENVAVISSSGKLGLLSLAAGKFEFKQVANPQHKDCGVGSTSFLFLSSDKKDLLVEVQNYLITCLQTYRIDL